MGVKKIKGTAIVLLAFVLVMVTACSSNKLEVESTESSAPSEAATTQLDGQQAGDEQFDPLGKFDPPIEVTTVRAANILKFDEGETYEKNGWMDFYESEFGIKVKLLWASDQFDQKMNTTMVSGKLPDIMPLGGNQYKRLAEMDQLEDLTEALEKYGSEDLKRVYEGGGKIGLDSVTKDGKILALPWLGGYTGSAPLLWIRTDWMEKLNLSEPQSMDDVLKIAEAFVNQDPDGNDQKDTYGLVVNKDLYTDLFGIDGFFNSYHAYPKIWVKNEAGEIVYGSIQPQMKTALAKLQELYKNGTLDKEFVVKDADKVGQMVNAGKLGITYSVDWLPLYLQSGKNQDPNMEWKPYPLLSIDETPAKPKAGYPINAYYSVRKGFEHPEALVKMMNASLVLWSKKYPDRNLSPILESNNGVEKWVYRLVHNQIPTQNLDAFKNVNAAIDNNDESLLNPNSGEPDVYRNMKAYLDGDIKGWGYYMDFGPEGSQSILTEYDKNNAFNITEFIGVPTPKMVEQGDTLAKLELSVFTKIIMGEASIDSFDEFVANWKKLGGDEITREVQAAK
ncbi:extracellular solute-binding protein [Paenibacillus agaridevorans]|uniref:extracellular solute-binding protein n=1 Tax=Paenibacillus agaridevorans TaxID=171404 RepID=UPI001BE4DCF3|nr:extracellular solute-binding protein [Paenibacillus agaridevorans]